MHPGFINWWDRRRAYAESRCGVGEGGCGPSAHGRRSAHASGRDGDELHGAFGVRRPLRFLAWKLELEEEQVAELAKILDDLKTERAQAAVDNRRTLSAFADAVAGEAFDEPKATEAGALRVQSAERLRDAVVNALRRIHAVLDREQRDRLAYLVRTGALTL